MFKWLSDRVAIAHGYTTEECKHQGAHSLFLSVNLWEIGVFFFNAHKKAKQLSFVIKNMFYYFIILPNAVFMTV